jgi:DNA modification methylase
MTKEQVITEDYAIYNSDCMEVIKEMPDESVDLSVYSPPCASLYTYSSSERDMSNVSSIDQFVEQYEFLVKEMSRVTKKGRINAIHITDICDVSGTLDDFPNRVIQLYKKHGFEYKNRITVWKEPLKVRIKTMVQSLMHKYIMEDSTKCFTANPDYKEGRK